MTREEGKEFANALKNNYTIDFDKISDFCDLVISALSEKDWKFYYNHGYAQAKRDLSENKGDLISRQAVLELIDHLYVDFANSFDPHTLTDIYRCVKELPSVENERERICRGSAHVDDMGRYDPYTDSFVKGE